MAGGHSAAKIEVLEKLCWPQGPTTGLIGDSKSAMAANVTVLVRLSALTLQQIGTTDLSRVRPASRPMQPGIGSSPPP